MNSPTLSRLFSPVQVGPLTLSHRVVMAPLTRSRSEQPGDVPGKLMLEYYTQRASDGGLIVSEATTISLAARGWFGAPGLYSEEQVIGWRKITDAVHAKGGHMFSQLWHTGRTSHLETTGGLTPVSASVDPAYWNDASHLVSTPSGWKQPSPHRALEIPEIAGIIEEYRRAAERAKAAGFDGVELHSGNGYLIDQFLQDGSNKRTDAYGGSFANRSRLLLEVVAALVSVWGDDRVAVRIAPGGSWNGMSDSDPTALFNHVAQRLNEFRLAYLHIIEPRIKGNVLIAEGQAPMATERLRRVFKGKMIAAGGFEPDSAEAIIEKGDADLVAFGRHFLANPDLPKRIRLGLPLNAYDRATFYTFDAHGYTDYPFYKEEAVESHDGTPKGANGTAETSQEKNRALVLDGFDTLFNRRDYAAAERFWSPDYIQHSAHIGPGRDGLFNLIKSIPPTLKYEPGVIMAEGDLVIIHGRFSGFGAPANWIAADIIRVKDGLFVEHWDVIQDEATKDQSKSGNPMYGDKFPG